MITEFCFRLNSLPGRIKQLYRSFLFCTENPYLRQNKNIISNHSIKMLFLRYPDTALNPVEN
uniref:Uncharacterized protein n=1 Tax=Anguilla anguilla TaxID=7936 RepID=A0A0E9VRY0_ANGAN